jgi:hypothetical protein
MSVSRAWSGKRKPVFPRGKREAFAWEDHARTKRRGHDLIPFNRIMMQGATSGIRSRRRRITLGTPCRFPLRFARRQAFECAISPTAMAALHIALEPPSTIFSLSF